MPKRIQAASVVPNLCITEMQVKRVSLLTLNLFIDSVHIFVALSQKGKLFGPISCAFILYY